MRTGLTKAEGLSAAGRPSGYEGNSSPWANRSVDADGQLIASMIGASQMLDLEVDIVSSGYNNGTWSVNLAFKSYKIDKFGIRKSPAEITNSVITASWSTAGGFAMGSATLDGTACTWPTRGQRGDSNSVNFPH